MGVKRKEGARAQTECLWRSKRGHKIVDFLSDDTISSQRTTKNFSPPYYFLVGKNQGLFNNAAQVWNHNFYWNCLKPNGGGVPTGKIAALIDRDLGGYEAFR